MHENTSNREGAASVAIGGAASSNTSAVLIQLLQDSGSVEDVKPPSTLPLSS